MSAISTTPSSGRAAGRPPVPAARMAGAVRLAACAAALGGVSHGALAQSSGLFLDDYFQGVPYAGDAAYTPGVSLYGVVDESLGFTKGAQTSFFQQSNGQWTSKIGLYGVEDLGGGYRVRFSLESGFNPANGQPGEANTLFNREAWVGIGSAKAGELKFGRQDDVGVPLFVDVFGQIGTVSTVAYQTAWVYDLGPGASFVAPRLSNAVSYSSPWFGPLNAQVALELHEPGTNEPTIVNKSVVLNYFDGHLFGALSYGGNYGLNALTASQYVRTDNFAAGLLYDGGHYVVSAGYSFLAPRLDGDRVASLYTLGALYRYRQRNDFRVELAYRTVGGVSDHSYGITLGYDYNLSKRTALYVRGALVHNTGAAPSYGSYPSQQPTVDNIDNSYVNANGANETYQSPHVVLVGMYHKF